MGKLAMSLMGPVIGVAVAYGLNAPPLVMFSAIVSGAAGAALGGPAGSFAAALISTEIGKLVSKETKVDIIITPLVTIFTGYTVATLIGPGIDYLMKGLGSMIMWGTEQRPIIMGIVVAVLMGLALTAPISSAAIAMMLDLHGLAAGAASSNIIRHPLILIPPTLAGAILAAIGTTIWTMESNAAGAGMGTSGFVGQIMTFTTMGFGPDIFMKVVLLHFIGPAVISLLLSEYMRKKGWIKFGNMKIHLGGVRNEKA